jgi:two-component system chemotaxis sensor kinase CheA
MDLVNQIFRALHTIKGSGSMFGFEEIAAFTHEVETVFDMVRNGDVQATPVLCSLALRSRDQIRAMLDAEDDEPVSQEGMQDILDGLQAFVEGTNETAGGKPVQAAPDEEPEPEPESESEPEPETEPAPEAAPDTDLHQYTITLRPLGGPIDADAVEAFFEELERLGTLKIESGHRDTGQGWELSLATEAVKENVQDVFFFLDADLKVKIDEIGAPSAPEPAPAEEEPAPAAPEPAPAEPAKAEKAPQGSGPATSVSSFADEDEPVRIPRIGEMLVESGDLTYADVAEALTSQKSGVNKPLGQILTENGKVPADKVNNAVKK